MTWKRINKYRNLQMKFYNKQGERTDIKRKPLYSDAKRAS